MNKKLMAVAVAGAFIAPAAALAQNATVQIYGKATFEYGYADQGAGRPNSDVFQTPGGSAVGVKGEEKLGGGLSAWFQCESSADVRGLNQDGFCSRNSAVGLKGAFGNLHFGRWDTPYKRAHVGMVGGGDTGLLGQAFLFAGSSTGTAASGGIAPVSLGRNIWKRRESSLIYYESPVFSGFQVLAAFSAANATSSVDASTAAKPRVLSISGLYNNGPLSIGLGYEKHQDFGNGSTGAAAVTAAAGTLVTTTVPFPAAAPGTLALTSFTAPRAAAAATLGTGSDDRGWTIGASYTFAGKVKVGAQYSDYDYDMAAGTDLTKKNWLVGVEWNIAGPHNLDASWVRAGDSKGSSTVGIAGGNGPLAAPVSATAPLGTGADLWQIAYRYTFSKRTWAKLAYVKLDNDGGASYSLGGLATPTLPGESQSAFVMYVDHRF